MTIVRDKSDPGAYKDRSWGLEEQVSERPTRSHVLYDKDETGALGILPVAGFANPSYFGNTIDTNPALGGVGFGISDCTAVVLSFENGATASVTYEQSLDPTGLDANSWFTVMGKQTNNTAGILSTAGSLSGSTYVVPVYGKRMRVKVTALSVADLWLRIMKIYGPLSDQVATGFASTTPDDGALTNTTTASQPIAVQGRTTQKANMSTDGDKVTVQGTLDGKPVFIPYAIPELTWASAAGAGGIASSTVDVVLKTSGGAGIRNFLRTLNISHDVLGAVTEWVVKDGASIIARGKLQTPASDGGTIMFEPPLRGSAATAMNFALLTSVTGGVYVNAQGFTGN